MAKGKLVLEGVIELRSPALIGCGSKERSDVDIIRDGDNKPFIPATSFVGALMHYIKIDRRENNLKQFWGFTTDRKKTKETGHTPSTSQEGNAVSAPEGERVSDTREERQSSLRCRDLTCKKGVVPKITIRDGIAIEAKTGIVKPKKKYDYEVIEPGAQFDLHLEVSFENEETRNFSRSMLATISKILEQEEVRIGAKANSGLGKILLSGAKISEFDFGNKQDVFRWLKREYSPIIPITDNTAFTIQEKNFTIDATFSLKNSLIIRSYPSDPKMPDAVHIQSGGNDVLPGASLKGAIRSRAERIIKTLFDNGVDKEVKAKKFLTELFGDVDDKNQSKKAYKGKVRVDEINLPKFTSELQTRIKIDRFTGGTIESALLETMPLFSDGDVNKQIQNVRITIRDYKDYEAGLMLLVLKDLWTGDLAVGGEKAVGRGVFEGVEAKICWDNGTATLKAEIAGLSIKEKENENENEKVITPENIDQSKLGGFVFALKNYKEGANNGK